MMKTKLLLVLLVAVGLVAPAAQANLLKNPSFEEGAFGGTNDTPDYWTHYWTSYTPVHSWISSADQAHWGGKYMKMNRWSTGSTGWLLQTVDVTEGQEYAFSVWAKCAIEDDRSEVWGYIDWLDSASEIISEGWFSYWDWVEGDWEYADFGTLTAPALATQAVYYLAEVPANGWKGLLLDDAYMGIPLPSFPSPAWEGFVHPGNVDLSWTNLEPNPPATSVYVKVLFGTEPNETNTAAYDMEPLTLDPVSGQDVTSVTVEDLAIGTYYWQVKSYLEGDPAEVNYDPGDPNYPNAIKGHVWSFTTANDLRPSVTINIPAMITWQDEPVQLDATVIDEGASPLLIEWTTSDTGVTFDPNEFVEDPVVSIHRSYYSNANIANPSFEDELDFWDKLGSGHGTWTGTYLGTKYINPSDGYLLAWANSLNNDGDDAGLSQILAETLTADTTYTLTVDVANDGYYSELVDYRVQLLAGGVVLEEDNNEQHVLHIPGGIGIWKTSTVEYVYDEVADANKLGEPLEIRLLAINNTNEMSFDNVELIADPGFIALPGTAYTLMLTATDNVGSSYDMTTADVYDTACQAARIGSGLAAENPGDVDADCDTDLYDLAELVITWLEEPDGLPTEAIIGSPRSTVSVDGLVEYWQLDGDYSAKITSEHEGTLTTTGSGFGTFVTGKFDNAIDLENSNDNQAYLVVGGDENDFDFAAGNMSVSLWYTTESLYANWQCMVAKGEGDNWRLHRYNDSPTDLDFYCGLSASGDSKLDQQSGSWHHMVATADTTNGNGAKLYIDGSLVRSASGTVILNGNNEAMQIGGNPGASGRGWDGILDDVAVWNRALDADEVSAIWDGGTGASIESFIITDPTLPTVSAGNDWIAWSGVPVVPNASAVNNGVGDLTYAWTADPDSGVVFSPSAIVEAPTVTITKAASTGGATAVRLTLAVNNEGSGKDPVTDSMVIDVYDDACQAKIATGQAPPYDPGDVNLDCFTDIKDFAETAETWLEEYTLMEPAPKP